MWRWIPLLLLAGCTMEGHYDGHPHLRECRDLRTGEAFTFHTNTIHDVEGNLFTRHACMSVVDQEGVTRRMCNDEPNFLECQENY